MGAIQFIENLDRTSLTISDEEFERNVEAAVSAIAEGHEKELPPAPPPPPPPPTSANHIPINEKSAPSRPEVTPRNSTEVEYSGLRRPGAPSSREIATASTVGDASSSEDNAAVAGLLRTIQRPLSTIGRIFSEDGGSGAGASGSSGPPPTPQPPLSRRLSPAVFQPPTQDGGNERERVSHEGAEDRQRPNAEDAAARQASAEAAEALRIQRAEHRNVVEYVPCTP